MNKIQIIVTLLLCSQIATAQQAKPKKRLKLTDVYVQAGGPIFNYFMLANDDYAVLAPNSTILNKTRPKASLADDYYLDYTFFAASVGLRINDTSQNESRFHHTFRIGLNYLTNLSGSKLFLYGGTYRVDTLVSANHGNVFVDSTYINSVFISYSCNQIKFDAAFLLSPKKDSKFELFAGVGFSFNKTLNAITKVSENYSYSVGYSNSSTLYKYKYIFGPYELYKNRNGYGFQFYFPIGFDFRIGRKGIFEKTHLIAEVRPTLEFIKIPELRTFANQNMPVSFGLRYKIR